MQDEHTLRADATAAAVQSAEYESSSDGEATAYLDDEPAAGECEPYPFAADITGIVNQFPNDPEPTWGYHRMRQATAPEYESYLAMMPTRRITTGGRAGQKQTQRNLPPDEAKATDRLYNRVVKLVGGYEFDEAVRLANGDPLGTGEIMFDVDAQAEIRIEGANDDDIRRLLRLGERVKVPDTIHVYDLIPTTDKVAALVALAAGTVERKREAGRAKRLGSVGVRTWTFVHKIGVSRRPDGSLTPPKHVIEYVFDEWDEKTLHKFRTEAMPSSHEPMKGGGTITTTRTNLRVVLDIARKTMRRVTGGLIAIPRAEGEGYDYITPDPRNPDHFALIPPAFLLGATTKMFVDLEAESKV